MDEEHDGGQGIAIVRVADPELPKVVVPEREQVACGCDDEGKAVASRPLIASPDRHEVDVLGLERVDDLGGCHVIRMPCKARVGSEPRLIHRHNPPIPRRFS